jgi:shikimate kinase
MKSKKPLERLNAFLKGRHALLKEPLYIFITGASGAGKSYLTHALEKALDPQFVAVRYFDHIGVPPLEEMVREYGSGEKWQEAMTHQWVERLSQIQDKKVIILEGQFNPRFSVDACQKFGIHQYALILLHAGQETREHRLVKHRRQPELANETMENWAQFLKRKTQELGGAVIHTSASDLQTNLDEIAALIEEELRQMIVP